MKLVDTQNLLRLTMKWWISLLITFPKYQADPKGFVLDLVEDNLQAKAEDAVRKQYSRAGRKDVSMYERGVDVAAQRAKMSARYGHSEEDLVRL